MNIQNITGLDNDFRKGHAIITSQFFNYDVADQLVSAGETNHDIYNLDVNYQNYGRIGHYHIHSTDPVLNLNQYKNIDYQYNNFQNSFAADVISMDVHTPTGAGYGSQVDMYYGINGSLRQRHTQSNQYGVPHDEFYLFDVQGNMNAYSDNGETYAYYGYDDAGQRTYKMVFSNINGSSNAFNPSPFHLQLDNLMFYPNGFINLNQYGEYTKHYYAENQRIASKVGSGSIYEDNLCDNLEMKYNIDINMLNNVQDEMVNNMMIDLQNLTIPATPPPGTIEFGTSEVCNLAGDSSIQENEFYFYIGNHLSSVQYITDINATVIEQVFYAPFGEIIGEYVAWYNGNVPAYRFNAKELDEESGMYYFEARYQSPPVFISRDVMFEARPYMSPYAYCSNSPLTRIDPSGMLDGDYYDEKGTWLYNDGIDDNKIYEVKFHSDNKSRPSPFANGSETTSLPVPYASNTATYVGDVTEVKLEFTGQANENRPNFAEGQLNVIQVGSNGKEYNRMSVDAVSGAGTSLYALPNGDYESTNPHLSSHAGYVYNRGKSDCFGFAIDLRPLFATNRSALQIHYDEGTDGSAGCISLRTNRFGLDNFYKFYKSAYNNFGNIKVNVAIQGNPNCHDKNKCR